MADAVALRQREQWILMRRQSQRDLATQNRFFACIWAGLVLAFAIPTRAESLIGQFTASVDRVTVSGHKEDSQQFVVRIVNPAAPYQATLECHGKDFDVVLATTSLSNGRYGDGFVFMRRLTNVGPGDGIYFGVKDLKAGVKFTMRGQSKIILSKGILTFGDVTLSDGNNCPVTLEIAGK